MKNLFVFILLVATLMSCGSDDEVYNEYVDSIVGTWVFKPNDYEYASSKEYTFTKDLKCIYKEGSEIFEMTYSITEDLLYLGNMIVDYEIIQDVHNEVVLIIDFSKFSPYYGKREMYYRVE